VKRLAQTRGEARRQSIRVCHSARRRGEHGEPVMSHPADQVARAHGPHDARLRRRDQRVVGIAELDQDNRPSFTVGESPLHGCGEPLGVDDSLEAGRRS
jgi:hypothetical protein